MGNNFFALVSELQKNIDWLNRILKGSAYDSVIIDNVVKPSISKDIADKWSAINGMVQGRAAYETKAQLPSPPPSGILLAEVWRDSEENNGLWGWSGGWVKSTFDLKQLYDARIDALEYVQVNEILNKLNLTLTSGNLVNTQDPDYTAGYFVNWVTGKLQENADFDATGYIPVTQGKTYYFSHKSYLAWFDKNMNFIEGYEGQLPPHEAVAPVGARYLRASISIRHGQTKQNFYIYDFPFPEYLPYGFFINPYSLIDIPGDKLLRESIAFEKTKFLSLGKNIFNYRTVTHDGFMGANGEFVDDERFCVSDYLPVVENDTYVMNHSTRFVTAFDHNRRVMTSSGSNDSLNTYVIPKGVSYIKVTLYQNNLLEYQVERGSVVTSFESFRHVYTGADFGLPKNTFDPECIIPRSISSDKAEFLEPTKNRFNYQTVTPGFMGANGDLIASDSYSVSDFIEVESGQSYFVSPACRFYTAFDSNKNPIESLGTNDSHTAGAILSPSSDVRYYRITFSNHLLSSSQVEVGSRATAFEKYGYRFSDGAFLFESHTDEHKSGWSGLQWATLGDSITAQNTYQPTVSKVHGLVNLNFGVGGSRITGEESSKTAICRDYRINQIPEDMDLIVVMGGTNDWAQSVVLGGPNDTDGSLSFFGGLNTLFEKLSRRFPSKRIVAMTTPYGELYEYEPRGWQNAYTNNAGLTTNDYAESIRIAAKRWGIPVIDVNHECGWNTVNIREYIKDDGGLLHPNNFGGKRIADVIVGRLFDLQPNQV